MDNLADFDKSDFIDLRWNSVPKLVRLSAKLFLLRIFTLGIYHFWGKVDIRRRIWSAIFLKGQPFEYTGTGKELFLGFLVASFIFIFPLYAAFITLLFFLENSSTVSSIVQTIIFLIMLYLFGVAQYRARRYRLTRTRWRGIRCGMSGSPWRYGLVSVISYLTLLLTAGWMIPWRDRILQKKLVSETRFGSLALKFDSSQIKLYPSFAISWFGVVAVILIMSYLLFQILGRQLIVAAEQNVPPQPSTFAALAVFLFITYVMIVAVSSIYQSKKFKHFAKATTIDQAELELNSTPLSMARLYLGNILLTTLTLGMASPIVQSRIVGYFIMRMSIKGSIDFSGIKQDLSKTEKIGEGLAEAFDIDAF